jgi:hypothetical protein
MLKVRVEIFPFGDEFLKRILLEGKIWNDATGTPEVGNYKYTFTNSEKKIFNGKVKDHNRSEPVHHLLMNVLNDISKKEKKSYERRRSSKM